MAGVAYGQLNYCAQRAAIRLGLFAADNDRCDQLACDSIPKFGQDERKIVDKTKEAEDKTRNQPWSRADRRLCSINRYITTYTTIELSI